MTNYLTESNLRENRLTGLQVRKDTVHHGKEAMRAGARHSYGGRFAMFTSQQNRKQRKQSVTWV